MKKVIIKLGGSIITDRNVYCTSKMENIDRLCFELSQVIKKQGIQVILIIGAGSYGHQTINEYKLHQGYKFKSQLFALKTITNNMWNNGNAISESLTRYDIPSYCIHTPSYLVSNNGEIEELFYAPIKQCLACGIVPIVWGEINFDQSIGFTNVSGDKIAISLSSLFRPEYIYSFTDVDGVIKNYGGREEEVIRRVSKMNYADIFKEIKESSKIDVNGGMLIKYESMCKLMLMGFKAYIGNGEKENLLYNVLNGNNPEGTYFEP